jgi:hypothetical protein
MMTYKINSQDGRLVNVTLDFGNGETLTKKMDIQPVGIDAHDAEGRAIIVLKDPFDDIDTFFNDHMEAYMRGKEAQAIPTLVVGKAIDPVAAIEAKELAREAARVEEAI